MTFTDEDVQKLKQHIKVHFGDFADGQCALTPEGLQGLVDRLEAAENCIDVINGRCGHSWLDHDLAPCEFSAAMIQWRKTKGDWE